MSFDVEKLYSLLPAFYRIRDLEQGGPQRELLSLIAEQAAILEEDLDQLYDDQFIETCAEWIIPYIGDLIGAREIHSLTDAALSPAFSQRAQVANTIAYRRRKGTALMLEQLARDATGWDAKVVEYFKLLATTQFMNHLRPDNLYSPDLRKWEPLERNGTPFESLAHTIDVRQISSRRGRYNIPNIGIFLWRLHSYSLTDSPAFKVGKAGDRRYMFSPLGIDIKLYNNPESEDEFSHLSEPVNVPMPLSRLVLSKYLEKYYGSDKSVYLKVNGIDVKSDDVTICDLSDIRGEWAHMNDHSDKFSVDPVLGRILAPVGFKSNLSLLVSFYHGFSADIGGGEYERSSSFINGNESALHVPKPISKIQDALNKVRDGGVVEIEDSGYYMQNLTIEVNENKRIELRAANLCRPFIKGNILINGDEGAEATLNGLLIGASSKMMNGDTNRLGSQPCIVKVIGRLNKLRLRHCTLVPGISLTRKGEPIQFTPSLIIEANGASVEIDKCIVGAMRVSRESTVHITNSIVDATDEGDIAYSAPDDMGAGGPLNAENCTFIGKVHAYSIDYASNSIFMAGYAHDDPNKDVWGLASIRPMHAERLQQGCVRFCYLPLGSRVPRRYNCQPEDEDRDKRVKPQFTSLRYGDPGYCQLSRCCAREIRQGADDESEMGAFHDLFQPQRETNLRVRLEEYVRFNMEAGIFYES
jgi:hypothetical protein